MDLHQVKRLYHTLKHLKFTQVYHQIRYRLVKPKREPSNSIGTFQELSLIPFPSKKHCFSAFDGKWHFEFLNQKQSFEQANVDWSFSDYGLLWSYNHNYFDWLLQPELSKERGLEMLNHYYATPSVNNPIILHSYPTSLRVINAAKFISKWGIKEEWLYNELVSDLTFLCGRLEYHLLANHLLENAFALYIGGLITNQKEFAEKGKKLLVRELKEQVLNDGMHYERSPMYHLIILERLLDALNFASATNDDFEAILKSYAINMTSYAMNWQDLSRIPMMQDSAYEIALTVPEVLKYSSSLLGEDYPSTPNDLSDSGYREIKAGNLKAIANVGAISPSYQPGHAHADELSFELFYNGHPIIVDTGVSTYEKNERRLLERSTASHNCLTVNSKNTSDVWSGFRVGKRARVSLLEEANQLKAQHNGYQPHIISRSWCQNEGVILITDEIKTNSVHPIAKGRFHIHPDLEVERISHNSFKLGDSILLEFDTGLIEESIDVGEYEYAKGYNQTSKAKVITYSCSRLTKTIIREAR